MDGNRIEREGMIDIKIQKKKKKKKKERNQGRRRIRKIIVIYNSYCTDSLAYRIVVRDYIIVHAPTWLSPMRLARPTRAPDIALYTSMRVIGIG